MNMVSCIFILGLQAEKFSGPGFTDLGDILPVIIIPVFCILVGWLAWLLTRPRYLKIRSRIELHNQLAQKINSAQDFAQLVNTEEGRKVLEALSIERPTTKEEIVNSVRHGVILTIVGAGSFLIRLIFPAGFGIFLIAGVLIGVVGIGFLVSSAVVYRLSKSWGLI